MSVMKKDNNLPLISIVMVVYNGEKYIEEAIQSVIEQSYKNIEFIIIDGNSNDNTVAIINRYAENIDYFISEPDKGQSDAFNKAFKKCNGKLVTWLNADEILVPGSIAKVGKKLLHNPNIEWISGDMIVINNQKNVIKCRSGEWGGGISAFFGNLNVYGPSSFFSLDIYNAVGGMKKELHYTMDTDLWWRFYNHGVKLHRLGSYVYMFRMHEDSKTSRYLITNEINKDQVREKKMICDKYSKCNNIFFHIAGLFIINLFRFFSFKYLKSRICSIYFKDKQVDQLLNYLKIN